jgi:ATP-dependent helicase/nuclease subunit A
VLADRAAAKARLRQLVGHDAAETRAVVLRRAAEETLFPPSRHEELFAHLPPDPTKTRNLRFVDLLWQVRAQMDDGEVRFALFLGDKGEGYARKRADGISDPGLKAAIAAEHDRLAGLWPLYRRACLIERSEALLDLLGAIVGRYEQEKRARSRLDFDDLIERMGALLGRSEQAEWVRYKLDSGITHILVDESQDTNPEQWRVVEALRAEFFAGEGAVERPRTLFAVGDEKQSIFSFQGAEPSLFGEFGRRFEREAVAAGKPFAKVPLHTSLRTLPGVLTAVDRVFADPELRQAVLSEDEAVGHQTARAEGGGKVTLWPPVTELGDNFDPERWPLEPLSRLQSAPRRLAERIAGEIRGWLDTGRALGPRGRAVTAEDVLILVQSRSALFTELIRALSQKGIPTPGADRLPVTTHIAVLDLMALGDVLANPADDLQLAAVLRSPLFDIDEGALYAIAAGRPQSQTLWRALQASPLPAGQAAFARLEGWRSRLDFGRPFEFYATVLYREGGLRRFHARLGGEVDDVLAEFLELALAHEQSPSPSLQAFLAEMRVQDVSIKRELAEPGSGVRVMTVHGAKGLEAPIVILADAASKPGANQLPPVFLSDAPGGALCVHAPRKEQHTPETLVLRTEAAGKAEAEYWRKLYVGMTRAEDELYITGYLTRQPGAGRTWYAAVAAALAAEAATEADAAGSVTALVFPAAAAGTTGRAANPATALRRAGPLELPALSRPEPVPVVTPSTAHEAAPGRVLESAAEAAAGAEAARRGGLALHALLQHLPQVPRALWPQVVEKALAELLPEAPERHAGLGRKAIAILDNPGFARLFGPD